MRSCGDIQDFPGYKDPYHFGEHNKLSVGDDHITRRTRSTACYRIAYGYNAGQRYGYFGIKSIRWRRLPVESLIALGGLVPAVQVYLNIRAACDKSRRQGKRRGSSIEPTIERDMLVRYRRGL